MSSKTLPQIRLSVEALHALEEALATEEEGTGLLLDVDEEFQCSLSLGPQEPECVEVLFGKVAVFVPTVALHRVDGIEIHFREDASGQKGFAIDNPNAPPRVVELQPSELHRRMENGEISEIFDVRTTEERAMAHIAGTILLTHETMSVLESLPRDMPVAFQ